MKPSMPGQLKAARIIMIIYCAFGVLAMGASLLTLTLAGDMSENLAEDPATQEMLSPEEIEQLSNQDPVVSMVVGLVVLILFLAATIRLGRGGNTARWLVRAAAASSAVSAAISTVVSGGFAFGPAFSLILAVTLLMLNEVRTSREWFSVTDRAAVGT